MSVLGFEDKAGVAQRFPPARSGGTTTHLAWAKPPSLPPPFNLVLLAGPDVGPSVRFSFRTALDTRF